MPSPNEFLVLQSLQQALKGISVAAGYHYDLVNIAVKLDPNQDVESFLAEIAGPRPVIILAVQPDQWVYRPAGYVEITLAIDIHWFNDTDPKDDNSLWETYFKGCADVEQAIAIDPTRGNRVADTRIVQRTAFRPRQSSSMAWAQISTSMTTMNRIYGRP